MDGVSDASAALVHRSIRQDQGRMIEQVCSDARQIRDDGDAAFLNIRPGRIPDSSNEVADWIQEDRPCSCLINEPSVELVWPAK
jgi:hypothetical protein